MFFALSYVCVPWFHYMLWVWNAVVIRVCSVFSEIHMKTFSKMYMKWFSDTKSHKLHQSIQREDLHNIVLPTVEYTASAWDPYLKTDINKLEQVQRKGTSSYVQNNYWDRTLGCVTRMVRVLAQLAFYINLYRAVICPSAILTGRWRPDIDLYRMLTGWMANTWRK